jgi:hypothetical protein
LCGIIVALVTPALLQRQCNVRAPWIPLSVRTNSVIPNEFSSEWHSNVVFGVAAAALFISLYQMCY